VTVLTYFHTRVCEIVYCSLGQCIENRFGSLAFFFRRPVRPRSYIVAVTVSAAARTRKRFSELRAPIPAGESIQRKCISPEKRRRQIAAVVMKRTHEEKNYPFPTHANMCVCVCVYVRGHARADLVLFLWFSFLRVLVRKLYNLLSRPWLFISLFRRYLPTRSCSIYTKREDNNKERYCE